MVTRFLRNLLLIPIAVVLIALAIANRHSVTVSLNPFNPTDTALAFNIPVFWLLFAAVAVGVLIGGIASWAKQGRYRKEARVKRREAAELKNEAERLKQVATVGTAPSLPMPDKKKAA
ncbi:MULTISPECIES: LapA family protein [Pseudovibrio]|uniref:LapA family protein n=1 Tax=Stappiaceae TaxID=2821832 RepID=UPI0023665AE9|nr:MULTISPECIES: LapA family protein [Pseudovibrio]MDD7909785.1 LapA family protein [Pseudovibrio exalbescens]MDX5592125.1 LapA family protein [Pseudovibrio sp. SPO723]